MLHRCLPLSTKFYIIYYVIRYLLITKTKVCPYYFIGQRRNLGIMNVYYTILFINCFYDAQQFTKMIPNTQVKINRAKIVSRQVHTIRWLGRGYLDRVRVVCNHDPSRYLDKKNNYSSLRHGNLSSWTLSQWLCILPQASCISALLKYPN